MRGPGPSLSSRAEVNSEPTLFGVRGDGFVWRWGWGDGSVEGWAHPEVRLRRRCCFFRPRAGIRRNCSALDPDSL